MLDGSKNLNADDLERCGMVENNRDWWKDNQVAEHITISLKRRDVLRSVGSGGIAVAGNSFLAGGGTAQTNNLEYEIENLCEKIRLLRDDANRFPGDEYGSEDCDTDLNNKVNERSEEYINKLKMNKGDYTDAERQQHARALARLNAGKSISKHASDSNSRDIIEQAGELAIASLMMMAGAAVGRAGSMAGRIGTAARSRLAKARVMEDQGESIFQLLTGGASKSDEITSVAEDPLFRSTQAHANYISEMQGHRNSLISDFTDFFTKSETTYLGLEAGSSLYAAGGLFSDQREEPTQEELTSGVPDTFWGQITATLDSVKETVANAVFEMYYFALDNANVVEYAVDGFSPELPSNVDLGTHEVNLEDGIEGISMVLGRNTLEGREIELESDEFETKIEDISSFLGEFADINSAIFTSLDPRGIDTEAAGFCDQLDDKATNGQLDSQSHSLRDEVKYAAQGWINEIQTTGKILLDGLGMMSKIFSGIAIIGIIALILVSLFTGGAALLGGLLTVGVWIKWVGAIETAVFS